MMTTPQTTNFCPSYIYTYVTFGIFTNMDLTSTSEKYLQICSYFRFTPDAFPIHPSSSFLRLVQFSSRGTSFPTTSPFSPAWDVSSIGSVSYTHPACWLTETWSTCPIHSPPYGSSSEQSLYLLLSPEANGICTGCATS